VGEDEWGVTGGRWVVQEAMVSFLFVDQVVVKRGSRDAR
jgi:hypothetical protein